MNNSVLLAIETELKQIQADIAAGNLSKSEAEELLRDIDITKFVATTAEELEKKAEIQALLEATITIVSSLA